MLAVTGDLVDGSVRRRAALMSETRDDELPEQRFQLGVGQRRDGLQQPIFELPAQCCAGLHEGAQMRSKQPGR